MEDYLKNNMTVNHDKNIRHSPSPGWESNENRFLIENDSTLNQPKKL